MSRLLWRRAWSAVRQAKGAATPYFTFKFAAVHALHARANLGK